MNLQPLPNTAALHLQDDNILLIADLHLGIESELRNSGININSQRKNLSDNLFSLLKEYKPKQLIILGDIKHNIPNTTYEERNDVKRFLLELNQLTNVHIVPGNHDGGLRFLAPKEITIHPADGYLYKTLGLIHGHSYPRQELIENATHLICAHAHPTIRLKDRMGYTHNEPCWLKGQLNKDTLCTRYHTENSPEAIIMPSYNPLLGGGAANIKDPLIGALQNLIDSTTLEVYLLDGTYLGMLKDLEEEPILNDTRKKEEK